MLNLVEVVTLGHELLLSLCDRVLEGKNFGLFLVEGLFVEQKLLVGLLDAQVELLMFLLDLVLEGLLL